MGTGKSHGGWALEVPASADKAPRREQIFLDVTLTHQWPIAAHDCKLSLRHSEVVGALHS